MIDRAAEYATLARSGWTVTSIARKRRKSTGYVSVLLRLGQALEGVEPAEFAAFRHPRITFKLAQRIIRAGVDAVSIRGQLRYALGGFSTLNVDRRKLRTRRRERTLTSQDGATRETSGQNDEEWRRDTAWAVRDPLGYARAFQAHVTALHRQVSADVRRAVAARAPAPPPALAGQSLARLQDTLAAHRRDRTGIDAAPARRADPTTSTRASTDDQLALSLLREMLVAASSPRRD